MIIIIVSHYADDIILYLDHFDVSVSSISKEFDNFSILSGYKINWSKSALIQLTMLKLILLFPHLSLLRNLSSIWVLPYIQVHLNKLECHEKVHFLL